MTSWREKLFRANKHLYDLKRQTDAFFAEGQPHRFVGEQQGRDYVYRVKIDREPPLKLAIILGDVLYSLRSALDHVVYELAAQRHGAVAETTEFPIFKDGRKFRRKGRQRIRLLSQDQRTFIESAQPCRRPDPLTDALWVLHELNNADKHRSLNLALFTAEDLVFTFVHQDLRITNKEVFGGALVNDAPVARVTTIQTGLQPKMAMHYKGTFNVSYDEGALFGGRPLPTLLEIRDRVREVAETLAKIP